MASKGKSKAAADDIHTSCRATASHPYVVQGEAESKGKSKANANEGKGMMPFVQGREETRWRTCDKCTVLEPFQGMSDECCDAEGIGPCVFSENFADGSSCTILSNEGQGGSEGSIGEVSVAEALVQGKAECKGKSKGKSTSTISEDLLDMETPRIPESTPAAISEDDVLDMETPRIPESTSAISRPFVDGSFYRSPCDVCSTIQLCKCCDNAGTFVCFTCWDGDEEPWGGETPAISEDLLDMEIPRIPKSTPAMAPRIPKSTSTISEDLLDMETPRIPKSTPAAISEDDVLDMETPRSPKRLRSSALDESQTM
jgi:hypothetical protein